MMIDQVETFVVGNPPPRHGGRYFIFVTLTTDSGVKGVGEAYVATVGPHLVAQMIEDVADRWLVGQSPFDVEAFWRRAAGLWPRRKRLRLSGRSRSSRVSASGGLG